MAAPLTKRQTSGHIENIKTAKLINKLQGHALEGSDMTPSQVNAAQGLLRKTLPDMRAIEHTGDTSVTVNLVSQSGHNPADD